MRTNDFILSMKYWIKCIKLLPYAVMYKDEAEDSRTIIANLKTKNETLENQLKAKEDIINGLLEIIQGQQVDD